MLNLKTRLIVSGLALATVAGLSASADAATRTEIKRIVIEEALNSRVPPALALAVAKIESDFQDNALSTAGARGVMQIMPKTARDEFGVGKDELWKARLNVQLGIDYLERLFDQYGGRWDLALSHYNGGTLKGGKGANAKPHGYTRKYVADVLKWRARYADQAMVWQVAGKMDDAGGWTPARTKVTKSTNDRTNDPEIASIKPEKIVVREIKDEPRVRRWSPDRRSAEHEQRDHDPDFRERLRRARISLDDFSSNAAIVRWYEG